MRSRCLVLAALFTLGLSPVLAQDKAKPDAALSAVQGVWKGALTYRDYSKPDRLVTLPTQLFVALGGPNELVLHYVFDDGPSKTVFSYERMRFDFANGQLTWTTGGDDDKPGSLYRITSNNAPDDAARRLTFEGKDGDQVNRYLLETSPGAFKLSKDEVGPTGTTSFRNKFEFSRPGG